MVLKAREKETERTAWELWLTFDGQAKKENPWGEYLKNFKKPPEQKDNRTEEEILKDAENIMKRRF
jgi:hypothetical protein